MSNGDMKFFAESTGFEPVGRIHDHGLANRSFNRSGNSPKNRPSSVNTSDGVNGGIRTHDN